MEIAENIAISFPIGTGGLSFASATKWMLISFAIFAIFTEVFIFRFNSKMKVRHEKIIKTVTDTLQGEGVYDTIKTKNTTKTKVTASPNVINVNLTC